MTGYVAVVKINIIHNIIITIEYNTLHKKKNMSYNQGGIQHIKVVILHII